MLLKTHSVCCLHYLTLHWYDASAYISLSCNIWWFFFQFYASNNNKEQGLRVLSWTRYRPSAFFLLCGCIGGINWPFRLATLSINLNSRCDANIRAPCIIPFFLRLLYPFQSPCCFLSKFSVSLHFFQSILKSLFYHLFLPPASERKILKAFYASSSYSMTGEISGFQASECPLWCDLVRSGRNVSKFRSKLLLATSE